MSCRESSGNGVNSTRICGNSKVGIMSGISSEIKGIWGISYNLSWGYI